MIRKALLIILITFLFSCATIFPNFKISAKPDIIDVPLDFPTIQAAINNASDGDMIFVHEGVYIENAVVNKTLSLIGESRDKTIIDGNNSGTVVRIAAENINVRGFTIRGGGSNVDESGVSIDSSFSNITDNIVTENGLFGMYIRDSSSGFISRNMIQKNKADGIILLNSVNTTLLGNTITENNFGLHLYSSHQNNISDNILTKNNQSGITLFYSSSNWLINNNLTRNIGNGIILDFSSDNNTLTRNTITATEGYGLIVGSGSNNTLRSNDLNANTYNFYCPAARPNLPDFLNDIDDSNMVNGKPIYYLMNRNGLSIDTTTFMNIGYLALINCTEITIQGINVSENGQGLFLAFTKNSIIKDVGTAKNSYGIQLLSSTNNTIANDTLIDNEEDGLTIDYSSIQNTVEYNKIVNNTNAIRIAHNSNENYLVSNLIANNTNGLFVYSYVSQSTILNNILTNSKQGIVMARECNNNTITKNTLADNNMSLYFSLSSQNLIFNNNFMNNTFHLVSLNSTNIWDDGYPSGGNFWSNYTGVDVYWGPSQDQVGSDGVGDAPYTIDPQNKDRYPLMNPLNTTEDTNPPFISPPSRIPGAEIMPSQEVKVSAMIFDRESGLRNVTLWYAINDSLTFEPLAMEYNLSTKVYEAIIPGQPALTRVKYMIIAFDKTDNKAQEDGLGQYFSYQVIPEYTLELILVAFMASTTLAVLFSKHYRNNSKRKLSQVV